MELSKEIKEDLPAEIRTRVFMATTLSILDDVPKRIDDKRYFDVAIRLDAVIQMVRAYKRQLPIVSVEQEKLIYAKRDEWLNAFGLIEEEEDAN